MRLGTWLQHVDLRDNARLAEQWLYGNRSILGGLVGAWLGVHVAKRLTGYPLRTGDLFAPAVALGMAVGRIGCLLTELPGTPTGHDWGITLDAAAAARTARRPACRCTRRSSTRSSSTSPPSPRCGAGCGAGRPATGRELRLVRRGVRRLPVPRRVRPGQRGGLGGLTRPQLFLPVTRAARRSPGSLAGAAGAPIVAPSQPGEPSSDRGGPHGTGMPLRGDRIHRYVNAFCPLCHEEQPDRPLAEVQRLSGWLVERDGRIWLERGCPTHGLVRTLYDESPEILRYLEQWTAPTKAHTPDLARQLRAGARGVPGRAARDADPAHLHPARGPARPLQPALPDLLRRLVAGARRRGAARPRCWPSRRPAVARERPHRRADALRRRADPLPAAGRAARRGGRAADRARPGQHQRGRGSPATTRCSTC